MNITIEHLGDEPKGEAKELKELTQKLVSVATTASEPGLAMTALVTALNAIGMTLQYDPEVIFREVRRNCDLLRENGRIQENTTH